MTQKTRQKWVLVTQVSVHVIKIWLNLKKGRRCDLHLDMHFQTKKKLTL